MKVYQLYHYFSSDPSQLLLPLLSVQEDGSLHPDGTRSISSGPITERNDRL